MAKYAYIRVSTDKQSYDQQIQEIKAYGINLEDLDDICEEHETTNKGYEDREFNKLFKKCKAGDTIYAASTDRIGRNFVDMMNLIEEGKRRGIEIIACLQRTSLLNDDSASKILLSVCTIIDEDEKKRIQRRTKNKKSSQKEQIKKKGYFIVEKGPNAGSKCSYVGTPKKDKMSEAQKARVIKMTECSARARTDAAILWRAQSKAVKTARRMFSEGRSLTSIVEELGKLYDDNTPDNPEETNPYGTPTGCKPSKGTVSRWLRESDSL